MKFLAHLIFFSIFIISSVYAEKGVLGDISWYVEVNRLSNIVFYYTHGTTVYGHEFGFYKGAGKCEDDIVWLVFSSCNEEVRDFKGEVVSVRLNLDGEVFEIKLDLLFVGIIGYTQVMYFSNWVAGERLIDALIESKNVKVQIIEPEELEILMDIKEDTFDLGGFVAGRKEAKEICKDYFKNKKQQISRIMR